MRKRSNPRLMDLLVYLAQNQDRVVSRDEILDIVWTSPHVTPHALSNAVSKLRRALGDDANGQPHVMTKRGFGYQLAVKVSFGAENMAQGAPRAMQTWRLSKYWRSSAGLGIAASGALIAIAFLMYANAENGRVALNYSGDEEDIIAALQTDGWEILREEWIDDAHSPEQAPPEEK